MSECHSDVAGMHGQLRGWVHAMKKASQGCCRAKHGVTGPTMGDLLTRISVLLLGERPDDRGKRDPLSPCHGSPGQMQRAPCPGTVAKGLEWTTHVRQHQSLVFRGGGIVPPAKVEELEALQVPHHNPASPLVLPR